MVCQYRLATVKTVNMVTDTSVHLGFLYQILDGSTLLTFDVKNSRAIARYPHTTHPRLLNQILTLRRAPCSMCSQFTAISYLEA